MFKLNYNLSQPRNTAPIQQSTTLGMGNASFIQRSSPMMGMVIPGPNGSRGCGSCGK